MPTDRPQDPITGTGAISEELDATRRHWSELRHREELLLRLTVVGHAAIERRVNQRQAARETAGSLSGAYRENELERLREDWPTLAS